MNNSELSHNHFACKSFNLSHNFNQYIIELLSRISHLKYYLIVVYYLHIQMQSVSEE